jgi:hypothetical protein
MAPLLSLVLAVVAVGLGAAAARADATLTAPQAGAYDVQVRIEIPNVSTWAWSTTRHICLSTPASADALPVPVLGPNNPFGACRARNIERSGAGLAYDIFCDGRGSAHAHATYRLLPDRFEGRIAIVLGAKNMTMSELQTGRRLGTCPLAAAQD